MRIRHWAPVVACVLLLPLLAAADQTTVKVSHGKLDPSEVTIAAGDTIVFENTVAMPGGHSLAADDGSFQSPALQKDGTWQHIFAVPGTYTYKIVEHPAATGTIKVMPADAE